jgi:hypothetical protein
MTCGMTTAPCVKSSPLMREGGEGVNPPREEPAKTRNPLPLITRTSSEHLGGITPTLTRPHQGGGNAQGIALPHERRI